MNQHQDPSVQRWLNDPNFVAFQRQMQLDMFVGRKHGVSPRVLKRSFKAFLKVVEENASALFEESHGCYGENVHGGWRGEIDQEKA